MLLGIPSDVKRFFRPVTSTLSKPISKALAPMVLAFLLAPHYRRLKTIAGMVVEHRVHVGTISRRLVNLRVKKTFRRYMVAARRVAVSKLGDCLVVTSYKENPNIELLEGQSGDWSEYRVELAKRRKKDNKKPSRWIGKVLVCTDTTATARKVVEWYELRWQIEIFFRELKSRMQLGCYVLMKFEAVERYLDLLLMGFILLEKQRLTEIESKGAGLPEQGDPIHHWRTSDRLRELERSMQTFNIEFIREKIKTKRGQDDLLKALEHQLCQVA